MSEKSRHDYRTLRASLIAKGFSLAGWARARGLPAGTVYKAANGTRSGRISKSIRAELKKITA